MDKKKSTAVSVAAVLSIMLFAVIGSCFMVYMYKDEKVEVSSPRLVLGDGVKVTNLDNDEITSLKFSEIKLGLKPVTGDLDSETKIPVTVTDKNGSEGIYAKFKVTAASDKTIKLSNLKVTGNEKLELEKERTNIWLSIKEIEDSTKNFEEEIVTLGTATNISEGKEFTLLFWFSSVASGEFESTSISFDVIIE